MEQKLTYTSQINVPRRSYVMFGPSLARLACFISLALCTLAYESKVEGKSIHANPSQWLVKLAHSCLMKPRFLSVPWARPKMGL